MSSDESVESSMSYQYIPRQKKTTDRMYDDFLGMVVASYGINSYQQKKFISLVEEYKSHGVATNKLRTSMYNLFHEDKKLYVRFCDHVLPSLMPELSQFNEHMFLAAAEFSFVENRTQNPDHKSFGEVMGLTRLFRDGDISLKHLTLEMRKLLQGKVQVMAAFGTFLPESVTIVSEQRAWGFTAISALVLLLAFMIWACHSYLL